MIPTMMIPAAPKTFWVREEGEGYLGLPVVGWTLNPSGIALPVVPGILGTSGPGVAIVFADHELPGDLTANITISDVDCDCPDFHRVVVDLASGKAFFDLEEWRDWSKKQGVVRTNLPNAGLYPALNFNGKVYLKASFWKVAQPGKTPLIFTLPGGSASPTDLFVTKITRDEFFAARKTLTEVPHLALVGGVTASDPPEDDTDDLI